MVHDTLVDLLQAGDRTSGGAPSLSAEFLRDTLRFAARYARLEKMLLGGIKVAYSPSALAMDLSITGDAMRQGEELARLERLRFELPPGPILEVDRLVEDQGMKILPRTFPAESAARGGFFFDGEIGPCIFHDAACTPAHRDYAIAHMYGHFLADYDPYLHTICGEPTPEALLDPRELRAHQFALSFLMPAEDLETYRRAVAGKAAAAPTKEFVQHLQVYFGVDNEIVLWRLLSLGWIDAPGVEALLTAGLLAEIEVEQIDIDPRLALGRPIPERYIHLVASAFGRGLIELPEAAEFLGGDVEEARRVLSQFNYADVAAKTPDAERPNRN